MYNAVYMTVLLYGNDTDRVSHLSERELGVPLIGLGTIHIWTDTGTCNSMLLPNAVKFFLALYSLCNVISMNYQFSITLLKEDKTGGPV